MTLRRIGLGLVGVCGLAIVIAATWWVLAPSRSGPSPRQECTTKCSELPSFPPGRERTLGMSLH
jgi:hypothetical protein